MMFTFHSNRWWGVAPAAAVYVYRHRHCYHCSTSILIQTLCLSMRRFHRIIVTMSMKLERDLIPPFTQWNLFMQAFGDELNLCINNLNNDWNNFTASLSVSTFYWFCLLLLLFVCEAAMYKHTHRLSSRFQMKPTLNLFTILIWSFCRPTTNTITTSVHCSLLHGKK